MFDICLTTIYPVRQLMVNDIKWQTNAIFYLLVSKTPQILLKDLFMAQQGTNSKDEIINFRVSQQKKNSFNQKFSDGERGKVLRWLLDGVLSNRIVVPKEVLQSE